jgi:hypothetical protein
MQKNLKEKKNIKKKQLKDKGNTVGVALIADLSVLAGVCRIFFSSKKIFKKKTADRRI